MIHALSPKELEEMNREILKWVKKALKGDHGIYVYNILSELKKMIDNFEREKLGL